jgi:DUF4097 and DUF4098 domain-containing protein YvlB
MSRNDNTGQAMSRRSLLGACATAGTACIAGCTSRSLEAETTATQEYNGAGVSELEVRGINGDIEIRDEQRETVQVDARKQAANEEGLELITLQDEQTEERLSLTVNTEDTGFLPPGPPPLRMDLTLTVPEGLHISAESTNGTIDIETTGAESVNANTTNGEILLSSAAASEIRANTTNSDVSITLPPSAEPAVSFETTNGEVETTGLEAGFVESDSGVNSTIGDGTRQITVSTTNGDLKIQGRNV